MKIPPVRRGNASMALTVCLALFLINDSPGTAQVQSVTVTGRGATRYEAREDAIRQALQQVVKQLVLADRTIENDQVILDRISSTMNGYVTRFEEVDAAVTAEGEVTIVASVSVAPSRLAHFLGEQSAGSLRVGNVIADAQRALLARNAQADVLGSLLSQFPLGSLVVSNQRLTPDPQDPSILDLWVNVRVSQQFVDRVREGMSALGAKRNLRGKGPAGFSVCFSDWAPGETSIYSQPVIDLLFENKRTTSAECWTVEQVDLARLRRTMVVSRVIGALDLYAIVHQNGEYQRVRNTNFVGAFVGPIARRRLVGIDGGVINNKDSQVVVISVTPREVHLRIPLSELSQYSLSDLELISVPTVGVVSDQNGGSHSRGMLASLNEGFLPNPVPGRVLIEIAKGASVDLIAANSRRRQPN